MFKKLKDKLAEEVKSSPQRIQQFAQAAQAAVTSASSSISDITNNDLFSIGDNDVQQAGAHKPESSVGKPRNTFQDVSLSQANSQQTNAESMDYSSSQDLIDNQRQRKLSNSSFASDVSFRLPSYESPSMYHLQSDMEISASEADERGFSGGAVSLDRVTKDQIYSAYRRTQERYTKYRTQYADLARHYKLLERENAKAKSVLVETQDKALRRISELREQCALEQSAKAHLEKALRVDIEERNMKIETLNTKIQLLQSNSETNDSESKLEPVNDNDTQLINLSDDNDVKNENNDTTAEVTALNTKIEKLEQLINKYKESLKVNKEKNAQLTTQLQKSNFDLENCIKENEQLKATAVRLIEAQEQIQELNDQNEELQNKINSYDFNKTKEMSAMEIDFQKSQDELKELRAKIEIFTKREEEYAISLAENKLSIHKELESKENEIKSLKDSLASNNNEVQSLKIVLSDYKNTISALEEEKLKLSREIKELNSTKTKLTDLETQFKKSTLKIHSLENSKVKAEEEFNCLQLQLKQETAEKLAMIDRNTYLESRNTQLTDDNTKKSAQIKHLDSELLTLKKEGVQNDEATKMIEDIELWKSKCSSLESEIHEEREELVKLQSEIEKLINNHELIQIQNTELQKTVSLLKSQNEGLLLQKTNDEEIRNTCKTVLFNVKELQKNAVAVSDDAKLLKRSNVEALSVVSEKVQVLSSFVSHLENSTSSADTKILEMENINQNLKKQYFDSQTEVNKILEQLAKVTNEVNALQASNAELNSILQSKETEESLINKKFESMSSQHEIALDKLKTLNDEKVKLVEKLHEIENKYSELQSTINDYNDKCSALAHENSEMEQVKESLAKSLKQSEDLNSSLRKSLDELKGEHKDTLTKLDGIVKEQLELKSNHKQSEVDKSNQIDHLEKNIKILTQENITLKSQSERIADSVKGLEEELSEVRKSHAEMESEKDHLNEIIEKLEASEKQNSPIPTTDQALQTEIHEAESAVEKRTVTENESILHDSKQYSKIDLAKYDEMLLQNDSLKIDNSVQSEENRRLQSDIAGLQAYLTKISKENSELNNKLREMMTSSENSPAQSDAPHTDVDVDNETQLNRTKIQDLMRENTLLIDENLELKDQLNSQHFSASRNDNNDNKEYASLKEKYQKLLESKNQVEKRMSELEQVNYSVKGNMDMMQLNNEKLRLSNEKLERRLDEALVSLRHLHSLQENTELEYLRNILYEYLTGSGTHSITLAKVLAAVVKFDDSQTQQVVQKEKERQGFLRQLGLL